MLRRSIKVLASITATAAVIITVLIVATVAFPVDQSEFNSPNSVRANETVHSDTVDALWCERYVVAFTIETDDAGEIVGFKSATDPAEMQKCIEAFKDGRISFDPRDLVRSYEAGYYDWVGFDHENIYDWDEPEECKPHYQFKRKSHPWWIDALGLVDTIQVTFEWTGTDTEWNTCFAAREKQISEFELSEFKAAIADSSLN